MSNTLEAIALYAEDTLSAAEDPPTAEARIEMLVAAIERMAKAAMRDCVEPQESA